MGNNAALFHRDPYFDKCGIVRRRLSGSHSPKNERTVDFHLQCFTQRIDRRIIFGTVPPRHSAAGRTTRESVITTEPTEVINNKLHRIWNYKQENPPLTRHSAKHRRRYRHEAGTDNGVTVLIMRTAPFLVKYPDDKSTETRFIPKNPALHRNEPNAVQGAAAE